MTDDIKATLHKYLTSVRESVLWKLDGLSEYDVRRPLTPTGTNLLGVVKHLAVVEAGYFGLVFNRPYPEELQTYYDDDDSTPDRDLWATADESRDAIVDLYRRVIAAADDTIRELPLDAKGSVLWWNSATVTLGEILVHAVAEVNRHAGHIDIVRELIDGSVGLRENGTNMFDVDEAWWSAYHAKLTSIAESFR